MPTWPTNKPSSNRFNSDSDSIKQSRTELKTMSDAVNDIVDFIDTTGIADGKILIYNASNSRFEIGDRGGLSNPLDANLETNEFTIGHLQGDDSAGGNSTAMRFTDNGEIHLFTSGQFTGGTGFGASEVKLANAKFDRSFSANPPGPGIAGDNTNYGPISLFSQDLSSDDSAGTSGIAKVGVLNNADGVFLSVTKTEGSTTFTGQININQRNGILLKNSSNLFDSGGEDVSGITLQTTAGNVRLEPNNTIYLKYTNWPTSDGSSGQVLQTNGSGQLSWATVSGGGGQDISAGDNITISSPDSAGGIQISQSQLNATLNMNDQQLSNMAIKNYGEIVHDLGTTSGTLTPDPNNGSVQKITLNNNLTLNALSNVAQGDSLTLLVTQDGTGGRTLSSTMKFSGGSKTLSTGANAIDVITIFYDGTNYLASLSTNFS